MEKWLTVIVFLHDTSATQPNPVLHCLDRLLCIWLQQESDDLLICNKTLDCQCFLTFLDRKQELVTDSPCRLDALYIR